MKEGEDPAWRDFKKRPRRATTRWERKTTPTGCAVQIAVAPHCQRGGIYSVRSTERVQRGEIPLRSYHEYCALEARIDPRITASRCAVEVATAPLHQHAIQTIGVRIAVDRGERAIRRHLEDRSPAEAATGGSGAIKITISPLD